MANDFDYGALLVLALDTNDAESLREQIEAAFVPRAMYDRLGAESISHISRLATEAGEAKGALEASEMAGVVRGWKARAEAAEAEVARLREALKDAEDRAWNEARELVRGTNADLCKGGAGQAYRVICEALTNAVHNPNLRTLRGRVEHLNATRPIGDAQ